MNILPRCWAAHPPTELRRRGGKRLDLEQEDQMQGREQAFIQDACELVTGVGHEASWDKGGGKENLCRGVLRARTESQRPGTLQEPVRSGLRTCGQVRRGARRSARTHRLGAKAGSVLAG